MDAAGRTGGGGSLPADLFHELSRANVVGLMLPKESEDVYESKDGVDTRELATRNPLIEDEENVVDDRKEEEGVGNVVEVLLEGGLKVELQVTDHDIVSEETVQEKIEKLLNRVVTRRQRAYLTGLLTDRDRAKTSELIRIYQERL